MENWQTAIPGDVLNPTFASMLNSLPTALAALVSCSPHTGGAPLPLSAPRRAVYLFSEHNKHLYVGRTNRLRTRYIEHCRNRHNDAPFAFKLARYDSGHLKAKGGLSRKDLELDLLFAAAFVAAKRRVMQMEFRWVEETDSNKQCLLEIYATLALNAAHNDFENH